MTILTFEREEHFLNSLKKECTNFENILSKYKYILKSHFQTYLRVKNIEFLKFELPNKRIIIIAIINNKKYLIYCQNKKLIKYIRNLINSQKRYNRKIDYNEIFFEFFEKILDEYYIYFKYIKKYLKEIRSEILIGKKLEFSKLFKILNILSNLEDNLLSIKDNLELFFKTKNVELEFLLGDIHQILHMIDTLEDRIDIIISIYYSISSHKLEEAVGRLTLISTIFLPATLIASIYGMNFVNPIPSWKNPYGFYIALTLIALSAIICYIAFKNKIKV